MSRAYDLMSFHSETKQQLFPILPSISCVDQYYEELKSIVCWACMLKMTDAYNLSFLNETSLCLAQSRRIDEEKYQQVIRKLIAKVFGEPAEVHGGAELALGRS